MVTIRVKNAIVPYKITLLSNMPSSSYTTFPVLVPYKITLLSNRPLYPECYTSVLVPYKITLLSNTGTIARRVSLF